MALNPTVRALLDQWGLNRTWVRGEGCWLFDRDGRRFLDCYAQYGAVGLGHNSPAVRAAVLSSFDEFEPAMVQPYRAPHADALAERLALASGLACCIFTTSGAETVEAAIKLVRMRTGRPIVLSLEGSFHGLTMGALAATGQRQHALGFGPDPAGFEQIPFGDVDALTTRFAGGGEQIAALLLEPIQGERGVHPLPPGYLARARELCTRNGAALILDEIQTGLGRTGRLFAFQHEGVVPDVLLLAKALGGGLFPLGACLSSAEMWDARFAMRHSSTFANNNIACRVGMAVLDELEGGLCERARIRGERLARGLAALAAGHPRSVVQVRGRGLLAAIELRENHAGLLFSFMTHQGLLGYAAAAVLAEQSSVLLLPSLGAGQVLRIAPPLIVDDSQIDRALAAIDDVLAVFDKDDVAAIVRSIGATSTSRINGGARPMPTLQHASPQPRQRHRYAFLVHYTDRADVLTTDPSLAALTDEEMTSYCRFSSELPPGIVVRAPQLRSPSGAAADGWIIALGMLPSEMLRLGRRRVRDAIAQAVDLAARLGAEVVGLGGHLTSYSQLGHAVTGRGPAITTGNALTSVTAVAALERAAAGRGRSIARSQVAVVGAGGSVGALCARLLVRARCGNLILLGNPASGTARLDVLCEELSLRGGRVSVATDRAALGGCDLILTATGGQRPALEGAPIRPGTILCDVARPSDVPDSLRARRDVTIVEGGLVALPDPSIRFGVGNLQGLPDGVQLACLSETILLSLSDAAPTDSVGNDISLATADVIAALALRHGFRIADDGPLDAAAVGL